ncbi:integrin alpha-L-like [Narcine bancroftii]|uniref:integrin alpha-L-like n=1 Tax=Narcine bancroftii TaxID=1343680 RepID=UPI0038314B0B
MKPGAQLDVTAVVENQAEIGHKPVLSIYSPSGITFRKVSVVKSNRTITVICEDRLGNNATTRTVCNVGHTAIREQTKVTLVVTFDVSDAESWNESFLIHLLLSSENEQASTQHDNNISLNVTVRYRVNLAIRSVKSVGYVTSLPWLNSRSRNHAPISEWNGTVHNPKFGESGL